MAPRDPKSPPSFMNGIEDRPCGGDKLARVSVVATRKDLHRRVDALSDTEVKRARIVLVDEVGEETSMESILVRHREQRVSGEEFDEYFGDLPRDAEG
jgi:hypothetical protein